MKTFRMIGLAIMAIILSFGLSACSNDDDVETTVEYSMSFSKSTGSSAYSEMGIIESAYKKALGVSSSRFTLNGTISSCNSKVKEGCDQAVKSLEGRVFQGEHIFEVWNSNSNKLIHQHEF